MESELGLYFLPVDNLLLPKEFINPNPAEILMFVTSVYYEMSGFNFFNDLAHFF